jgi:hypothetical protein
MVSAIYFLGFTGCSSMDAGTGNGSHAGFLAKSDFQSYAWADDDFVAPKRTGR